MHNLSTSNLLTPLRLRNDLLTDLSNNVDRLFSAFNLLPQASGNELSTASWSPKIDIKEEAKQFIIYADIPGIDPSAIEVSVDNSILTIRGQKESEKREEKENYLRIERSCGSFLRQMTLPEAIDANRVQAKCSNGVLTIVLPKSDKTNSKKIPIENESRR